MSPLDRVIKIIKENMVANAPGTGGAFGVNSPAEGPTAGTTEPMPLFFGKPVRRKKGKETSDNITDLDLRAIPQKYRKWIV
jgi:hypothetical protein